MLGIVLYAIGVMYTPGPVNLLSLNNGMQRSVYEHIPFSIGVASALCFWFLLVGYTGRAVINENVLPVVAGLGVCFIVYLAYKILSSSVDAEHDRKPVAALNYKDGLLMQFLNPKSFLVVLPVATVQFPAAGIEGTGIAVWSILLGIMGFGAPFIYAMFGSTVTRHVSKTSYLQYVNYIMGVMLLAVAVDMAYNHVYLAL